MFTTITRLLIKECLELIATIQKLFLLLARQEKDAKCSIVSYMEIRLIYMRPQTKIMTKRQINITETLIQTKMLNSFHHCVLDF